MAPLVRLKEIAKYRPHMKKKHSALLQRQYTSYLRTSRSRQIWSSLQNSRKLFLFILMNKVGFCVIGSADYLCVLFSLYLAFSLMLSISFTSGGN